MGSSDNFCLRWNDFESNISSSFIELRVDKDFFDVTLCCDEGGSQLQAHKVILAACSPLFKNILRRNPHQHPLIYLKGVDHANLAAVLNFMYHGEVNVAQDELSAFLRVSEELAVKGLTDTKKGKELAPEQEQPKKSIKRPPPLLQGRTSNSNHQSPSMKKRKTETVSTSNVNAVASVKKVEARPIVVKPDLEVQESDVNPESTAGPSDFDETISTAELEEEYGYDAMTLDDESFIEPNDSLAEEHVTIEGMTEEGSNDSNAQFLSVEDFMTNLGPTYSHPWKCKACPHASTIRTDLMRHVESMHYSEGYPCPQCDTSFRTKRNMRRHLKTVHKI